MWFGKRGLGESHEQIQMLQWYPKDGGGPYENPVLGAVLERVVMWYKLICGGYPCHYRHLG